MDDALLLLLALYLLAAPLPEPKCDELWREYPLSVQGVSEDALKSAHACMKWLSESSDGHKVARELLHLDAARKGEGT